MNTFKAVNYILRNSRFNNILKSRAASVNNVCIGYNKYHLLSNSIYLNSFIVTLKYYNNYMRVSHQLYNF